MCDILVSHFLNLTFNPVKIVWYFSENVDYLAWPVTTAAEGHKTKRQFALTDEWASRVTLESHITHEFTHLILGLPLPSI